MVFCRILILRCFPDGTILLKKTAVKVPWQRNPNIDDEFVSASIEDVEKEDRPAHMERLKNKKMFVEPGV